MTKEIDLTEMTTNYMTTVITRPGGEGFIYMDRCLTVVTEMTRTARAINAPHYRFGNNIAYSGYTLHRKETFTTQ